MSRTDILRTSEKGQETMEYENFREAASFRMAENVDFKIDNLPEIDEEQQAQIDAIEEPVFEEFCYLVLLFKDRQFLGQSIDMNAESINKAAENACRAALGFLHALPEEKRSDIFIQLYKIVPYISEFRIESCEATDRKFDEIIKGI